MSKEVEQFEENRRRLKAEYTDLFDRVAELLFRHDPMGINFEDNTDEYEPEVGTILPKLKTCTNVDDVRKMVHQEFSRWFDGTAGPEETYQQIATEIWQLWQGYLQQTS